MNYSQMIYITFKTKWFGVEFIDDSMSVESSFIGFAKFFSNQKQVNNKKNFTIAK